LLTLTRRNKAATGSGAWLLGQT